MFSEAIVVHLNVSLIAMFEVDLGLHWPSSDPTKRLLNPVTLALLFQQQLIINVRLTFGVKFGNTIWGHTLPASHNRFGRTVNDFKLNRGLAGFRLDAHSPKVFDP